MPELNDPRTAVLLCTAVHAIGQIISHEMYRNWNDDSIWDDPAWQNFTATFNNGTASLFNSTFSHFTITNNTPTLDGEGGSLKSYYWSTLPRELIHFSLIVALMCFWDIFLEESLPTRPQGVGLDAETERAVDLDEPQNEATLSRLVVKGTARRASISWGNTFLKWLIDVVLGTMWKSVVSRLTISSFLIVSTPL